MKKASITGVGLVTIHGIIKETAVLNSILPVFPDYKDMTTIFTEGKIGRVENLKPEEFIQNKKSIKFLSRQTILGCCAAAAAVNDSNIKASLQESPETSAYENMFVFGAGAGDSIFPIVPAIVSSLSEDNRLDYRKLGETGYRSLPPLWILSKLPNTAAGQITIENNIKGMHYTVVNGFSNGLIAIGEAYKLIRNNRTKVAYCGAAEGEVHTDYFARLKTERIFSASVNCLKPFDKETDGILPCEGSAFYVLEEREKAINRNVRIYADIIAYQNRYIPDFTYNSLEENAGYYGRCMHDTLQQAGLKPENIDFIQANGCGLPKLDFSEALAIKNIFGGNTAVTSCHAQTGFTLASSGAVSLGYAVLQMNKKIILPVMRSKNFYLAGEVNYVKENTVRKQSKHVLINSFDHRGSMSSLILEKNYE